MCLEYQYQSEDTTTTLASLKLVLIEWGNSHSERAWQRMNRIAVVSAPLYCRLVGWLLAETKDCKVIVPHIGGEKNSDAMMQGCGDLTIPA